MRRKFLNAQSVKASVAQQHKKTLRATPDQKKLWNYGMFTGNKYYLNHNLLVFLVILKKSLTKFFPTVKKMQCPVLLV